MTGESDLRRIEDIDGAALTYAEVKAIASGNPLIIEKARIDAEVARLSRLHCEHCEHQETIFKLRSRVRHLVDDVPQLEKRLEEVRRDLATRQDTSGDQFAVVIEGQEIRDRGIAGELLLRRAERMCGSHSDRQIGTIAGFQLFVSDNFLQGPGIVLKADTVKATDTALGTIRSVEHTIQHLEELRAQCSFGLSNPRTMNMVFRSGAKPKAGNRFV